MDRAAAVERLRRLDARAELARQLMEIIGDSPDGFQVVTEALKNRVELRKPKESQKIK